MQRKKRRTEKGKERASREGFEKKKCKGRKERRKKKGNRKGGAPRLLQADLERGAVRSLRPALTSSALRFGHVIVGIGIGIGVGVVAVVCIEVASSV